MSDYCNCLHPSIEHGGFHCCVPGCDCTKSRSEVEGVDARDATITALQAELQSETERADGNFTSYERVKEKYSLCVNENAAQAQRIERLEAALQTTAISYHVMVHDDSVSFGDCKCAGCAENNALLAQPAPAQAQAETPVLSRIDILEAGLASIKDYGDKHKMVNGQVLSEMVAGLLADKARKP